MTRPQVNPKTLKMLQLMGCFQEGVMKDTVAGKETQAHFFEYTTQVTCDDEGNVNGGIMPIQVRYLSRIRVYVEMLSSRRSASS